MDKVDPFTGSWIFRPALSKMSTPGPRRWVQTIECEGDVVSVREEIDFGEGHATTIEIEAKFNGKSYTVSGSPAADAIAYTRLDNQTISGTASRQGIVTIQETLVVTEDGQRMTMKYTVFRGKKKVAKGIAMFERMGTCR
jgi:hypothetical protein